MRRALILVGLLTIAFGLACLNYTVDGKADGHREFARERGLLEPSNAIFLLGLGSAVRGAAVFGSALGRRGAAR